MKKEKCYTKQSKSWVAIIIIAIAMLGLNASAASEWCNRLVNPPASPQNTVAGFDDAAYFTWETGDAGEIIVTMAPFNNNNARF